METSLKLQMDVKNNAEDLRRYMLDLNNWEEEMKQKEMELNKNGVIKVADIPPPRNRTKRNSSEKQDCKKFPEEEKKAKKIHAYDYSAWDKYDVDKACAELDEETDIVKTEEEKEEEEEEEEEENKELKNDTKAFKNIDEAFYHKDLGNLFVKKQKWEDAIKCYTEAINLDPKNATYYANRALCFTKLKNFKSAEVDATVAVQLDNTYIKAFWRRAIARTALGQLQEAKTDYQQILKLDPKNALANTELIRLEKLQTSKSLKLEEGKKPVKPIFDPKTIFKTAPKKESNEVTRKKETSEKIVKKEPVKQEKKIEVPSDRVDTENKIIELETRPNTKLDSRNSNEKLPDSNGVFGEVPDGFTIVKPVHIPAHLRSKKPLRRIPVKDIFSESETFNELVNLSNSLMCSRQESPSESEKKTKNDNSLIVQEKVTNIADFPVPVNFVQFQQAWKCIKSNIKSTYSYLKKIKTENLSKIFQHSLESDFFSELISSLAQDEFLKDHEYVISFLYHLSNVQRFDLLVLLMSSSDRENLTKCINSLEGYYTQEKIEEICNLYELRRNV